MKKILIPLLSLIFLGCYSHPQPDTILYDPRVTVGSSPQETTMCIDTIIGTDTLFLYQTMSGGAHSSAFYSTENLSRFFNKK